MAAAVEVRQFSTASEEFEDETLDPRVQVELEKLNKASDDINKLELELDEARASFRQVLTESTQRLNALSKKLGSCIEKARPYYEARMKAKEAQIETQNVALRFERACSQQAAAKEMVFLAEQGFFKKGQPFDPAWQEMLNHATIKVNDAERERLESEIAHQVTARIFNECEQRVKRLQKDLKRNIAKSRPYFEMKAKFNQTMEEQKKRVSKLEEAVQEAKKMYSEALNNLEKISDSIHQQRREAKLRHEMGDRGAGVGAEEPAPPPVDGDVGRSVHVTVNRTNSQTQTESDMLDDRPASQGDFIDPLGCKRDQPCNGTSMVDEGRMRPSLQADEKGQEQAGPVVKKEQDVQGSKIRSKSPSPVTSPMVKRATAPRLAAAAPCHLRPDRDKQYLCVEDTETVSETVSSSDVITPGSGPSSVHTTAVTSPETEHEPEAHVESTRTNMEIMESLQKAKNFKSNFLRPNRSRDDLLEEASDSESIPGSMASVSVLDDDQIENLMIETGDFVSFLAKHEEMDGEKVKSMTLPAKLSYLQSYISFKPEFVESNHARAEGGSKGSSLNFDEESVDLGDHCGSGDMAGTIAPDDMAAETQTLKMSEYDSCWSSEICSDDIPHSREETWQNVLKANTYDSSETTPIHSSESTSESADERHAKSFMERGKSLEDDPDFQRVYQELSAFEKLMQNSSSSEESPPRSTPTGTTRGSYDLTDTPNVFAKCNDINQEDKESDTTFTGDTSLPYMGDPLGATQIVKTRNLESKRVSANSSPTTVKKIVVANTKQLSTDPADENTEHFV